MAMALDTEALALGTPRERLPTPSLLLDLDCLAANVQSVAVLARSWSRAVTTCEGA